MILVALGSNLGSEWGPPEETIVAAIKSLKDRGLRVTATSRFYRSAAYPPSDQPDYINAVIALETELEPRALLDTLLDVEREYGRQRRVKWEARSLDLDLIDYDGIVCGEAARKVGGLVLPHPLAHERRFVLVPLRDIAPDWRDPRSGRSVDELIAALPGEPPVRALEPARP